MLGKSERKCLKGSRKDPGCSVQFLCVPVHWKHWKHFRQFIFQKSFRNIFGETYITSTRVGSIDCNNYYSVTRELSQKILSTVSMDAHSHLSYCSRPVSGMSLGYEQDFFMHVSLCLLRCLWFLAYLEVYPFSEC